MFLKFGVLLLLVVITHQTNYIPLVTLDAYQGDDQPPMYLIVPPNTVFPIGSADYGRSSTTLGIERDVQLNVESALANTIYSVVVDEGACYITTPTGGSSFTLLQYDGVDGSMSLQANGLKNFDATVGGNGTALFLLASADISCQFTIRVYSPTNSQFASITQQIPASNCHSEIVLPFSHFTMESGSGSFSNVGAIELLVDGPANIDVTLYYFGVVGQ